MRKPFLESSIALLMGGPGAEREVSLNSGAAVLRALQSIGADVMPVDVKGPDFELPDGTEMVFNVIHGTFGEDGQLQGILDVMRIPYTGEGCDQSRAAFDKIVTKRAFDTNGVPTPRWEVLENGSQPTLPLPFVIKPPREGSSVGVHIVKEADQIGPALEDCYRRNSLALVEEFIPGRELTVGILGDEALPIVEIVPRTDFYSYQNKYTKGASDYFCPAEIDEFTTMAIQRAALDAHRSIGLEVYSRVDVILDASGKPRVLEINTIPGMTETSLLPKAAAAAGIDFADLCSRIGQLSLEAWQRR